MQKITSSPDYHPSPQSLELDDVINSSKLLTCLLVDSKDSPYPSDHLLISAWRHALDTINENDPNLAVDMVARNVDGLHGTRSGSLLSILGNGLLAPLNQMNLRTPPITGEHYSQLSPRTGIHMVPWMYASKTSQFADDYEGLNLENYKDALDSDLDIESLAAGSIRNHYMNRRIAAERFHEWLSSGKATPEEIEMHERDYPVVLGLSLDTVAPEHIAVAHSSLVKADCIVSEAMNQEAITTLFVPESQRDYTNNLITQTFPSLSIPVTSLEQLREATANTSL